MKKTKISLAGSILIAASMGLTACSGGTSGTESSDTQSSSANKSWEGETLTVWIMEGTNADSDSFFAEVEEAFKEQTGANLQVEYQPWASAHDKFMTAIAGGTTPDVAEIGTTWTPEFAEAGALVDLTPQVDAAGLSDDLVEGLVEAGTIDGQLYGMPWYAGVRAFVYRADIFEELNIDIPETWDALATAAKAIKEAYPEMIAWPIAGDSQYGVLPFIWGSGSPYAVETDGEWTSVVNDTDAQKGISFYTGIATDENLSTAAASTWKETDLLANFETGNVGMMITGSWTPATIIADAPEMEGKIGAFAIPGPDGGLSPSFLGGSHLGIFNSSDKQDLAWEFVEMMTTGEFAEAWASQSGYFSGDKTLVEAQAETDDPLVQPFAQQMIEAGTSVPTTPLYGEIQGAKTLETMIQSILTGKATVEEATNTAADAMNAIFSSGS